MKNCTYCGRENSDDAPTCKECGTEFFSASGDAQISQAREPETPRAAAHNRMVSGALWCVGGIVVTVFSYMFAASGPGGGTYIIAWGAIVFGAIRFFRALTERNVVPAKEDVGYEALADGIKLEGEGRIQEALAVYQKIIQEHPDSDASNDAKKSIESLHAKIG
jgi:hypothetical protein